LELGCLVLDQTNVGIAGSIKHYGFCLLLQSDILYCRKKFVFYFFFNLFFSPSLSVRRTEAQQGENKLRDCNQLVAELQMWLKDAKRRLEQANNEELQLKVKFFFIYVNVNM